MAKQPKNQREKLQRERAFEAISIARRNSIPISRAAKQAHTSISNIKKWNSPALVQEGRKYRVKAFDRQARRTSFILPSELGFPRTVEGTFQDSRTVSDVNSNVSDVLAVLNNKMSFDTYYTRWRGRSFQYRGRRIQYLQTIEEIQVFGESGEAREVRFGSG